MKIAIPVVEGHLSLHFGHCEQFAFFEVDMDSGKILSNEMLTPPPHEPGIIPKWVAEQGASYVITGGMGQQAKNIFERFGVKVVTGAQPIAPEQVAQDFVSDNLQIGENSCTH